MFDHWSRLGSGLFDDFRRIQEELDEVTGRWPRRSAIRSVARGSFPAINVGSTPEQVDVYMFAAGLDPESVDLSLHHNLLSVAGKRESPLREEVDYYRKERFDGSFRRTVTLPDDVDPDRVEANYRDGVLHVRVQRRESVKPRRIEVS